MLPEVVMQKQYVQQFVQRGCRKVLDRVEAQQQLDTGGKMRHILMDWLVEVADLKNFSSETLYMGVALVDRFLGRCPITRKTLQLVGIACMVVASRYGWTFDVNLHLLTFSLSLPSFVEEEVITIREAAWLTDNTYFYEQIVRTIGQCLSVSGGDVRSYTHYDFLRVYLALTKAPKEVEMFAHYISELALLHFPITL